MFEIATCLRVAVQPNISCSAVSQLLVDLTCLGITDELLTNQSVTFRLCSLAITLLLCHRKHVQCTSSQDMHWRGCELHLKHWLKRHASLQAKVLPLKPVAFTCGLQSGMSCNRVQKCRATAATLPQLRCTGQGLDMSQSLCLCCRLSLACWDDHMGACSLVMTSLCSAEHGLCIAHLAYGLAQ